MKFFSFKLRYVKTRENTDLTVEINRGSSDKQDNQSSGSMLGLVKDYGSLIISVAGIVVPLIMEQLPPI